jgi:putative RecB family exonuclease
MTIYSYSRLETFEKCRLKFKYRYIDNIIPKIPKSIEAHLGTIVHETLEWFYLKIMEGIIPSMDDVILYYSERWTEEYVPEMLIVNKFMNEQNYFHKGMNFLIDYYYKHQPFREKTIATEKKIELLLDEKGEKKLVGFIDRLVHNEETDEFEIHDYKTANTLPAKEELQKNRQLALYSIAVKEEFGKEKNVKLVWHYLAHNENICIIKTNEDLENLKAEVINLINEIENTKQFPPSPSRLCDWCEYKDICASYSGQKKLMF